MWWPRAPATGHRASRVAFVPDESAEVVIVGGGAVGTSVAWHLTELGVTDVVLLERDALGSGSTSKSAGGIRAQFADELNVRIALRSLAELESFEERHGVDIGLVQPGYLFLLDREEDAARFRAALALQQRLGVPSREISPADAEEIVPGLVTDDLVAATFCPTDGYATPEAVVAGWASSARDRGVRIATDMLVCAAGAWSREVAALLGIGLPVHGERRALHFTPESGGLPAPLPLTVDFATGLYFHSEGDGLVFGARETELEDVAERAARRLPLLAELPVRASWTGLYEMSPDHNAIVGELADPGRFLYATGFSGHGFQQAPAVGEHLAELVVGREPTLDLSPFSLERFAAGVIREERFVI